MGGVADLRSATRRGVAAIAAVTAAAKPKRIALIWNVDAAPPYVRVSAAPTTSSTMLSIAAQSPRPA